MFKPFIHLKYSLLLFISLPLCGTILAQNGHADSARVLTMYEDCKKLASVSLDSTYECFREGLREAESIGAPEGLVAFYRGLSGVEALRGNVRESLEWVEKALAVVERHGLSNTVKLDLLINQGAALIRSGRPGTGLEIYLEAVEIARQEDLPDKLALLFNNLGATYRRLKRYEDAEQLYRESIRLRSDQRDTMGLANNYFNLAATYAEKKDYVSALESIEQARQYYAYLDSQDDLILCRLSTAIALYRTGREEESFGILDSLVNLEKLPFQLHDYLQLYVLLAEYHNKRQNFKEANETLDEIADYIGRSDLTDIQLEYYRNHAQAKNGIKDYASAYELLVKHNGVLDTLAKHETNRLRREMEEKYLSQEKDYQIQLQNLEIKKSSRQKLAFAIGLAFVSLLAFLLYRIGDLRKRSNRQLLEKNEIIKSALQEKDILLREIHHRVKNNLQFISSLLALQSEHIADANALSALQEGQDRVQSMALIHQNLYQEGNLTGVDVKDYFVRLIRNLFDSYNIRKDQVALVLDIDDLNLDVDTVVPIGLIVNELVSNSLKYAFWGGVPGTVSVRLKEINTNLILTVADNGKGITTSEIESLGASFGYRLIQVLRDQLKAKIDIVSEQGTKVTLTLDEYRLGSKG